MGDLERDLDWDFGFVAFTGLRRRLSLSAILETHMAVNLQVLQPLRVRTSWLSNGVMATKDTRVSYHDYDKSVFKMEGCSFLWISLVFWWNFAKMTRILSRDRDKDPFNNEKVLSSNHKWHFVAFSSLISLIFQLTGRETFPSVEAHLLYHNWKTSEFLSSKFINNNFLCRQKRNASLLKREPLNQLIELNWSNFAFRCKFYITSWPVDSFMRCKTKHNSKRGIL